MQASRPTSAAARGFTLVEILVVVVIIAILFTITTLSVDRISEEDHAREEVQRISALMELAADRAMIEGGEYGLFVSEQGYRFMRYEGRDIGWLTPEDRAFRQRPWPEGVRVEMRSEGATVSLESEVDADEERTPQVLLTATGEMTPFELNLRQADEAEGTVLEARMDGRREVRREGETSDLD